MILIDYSQCVISSILGFKRELKGTEAEVKNLIRHVIISTIKSHKKKYGKEYGEVVVACDGRNYWRKEIFAHYKASRKKSREASELDWKMIHEIISEMREDLINHFPYKVIYTDRAEADDIIAILIQWAQENQLTTTGLIEEPQKILILSSDKDFKQLQLYPNVKQWSPMQKKFVTATKKEIVDYKIHHIVKGDTGDGVPNILSDDDVFVDVDKRQKAMSAARLEAFIANGRDECKTDFERRNWDRNEQLVSFSKIPNDIYIDIINRYTNFKIKGDKMSIMKYLIKHKCRLILDDLELF